VKQCSILIVNCGAEAPYRQALERIGFHVSETREWPSDEMVKVVEVVIVLLRHMENVAMLGARMRAKPHFGQRVLIAVVPSAASAGARRAAVDGGFDDVVSESKEGRQLAAQVHTLDRAATGGISGGRRGDEHVAQAPALVGMRRGEGGRQPVVDDLVGDHLR